MRTFLHMGDSVDVYIYTHLVWLPPDTAMGIPCDCLAGAVIIVRAGGRGGRTHLLLALVVWPLTTHPFREGAHGREGVNFCAHTLYADGAPSTNQNPCNRYVSRSTYVYKCFEIILHSLLAVWGKAPNVMMFPTPEGLSAPPPKPGFEIETKVKPQRMQWLASCDG